MDLPGMAEKQARPLRVAVIGAAGRMGQRLVEAIDATPDLILAARVDLRPAPDASPHAARETVPFATGLFQYVAGGVDVAVEFTTGEAPARIGPEVERLGCAWVSGTTGLSATSWAALESASGKVPVLWSPNMSLGVALLTRLLQRCARLLPQDWEMEITEAHHAGKVDAPSGTAQVLAEVWQKERGGQIVYGRSGKTGPRPADEIGVHSLRLPEAVGDHRIYLGGRSEMLELAHRTLDRAAFVTGALTALRWLAGRPAGLYTLGDWIEDRLR
jgi:4-hydroxy-tetrahydrodipicolinate reductase